MNYIKLFQMQAELDSKIVEGKQLEGVDLFNNKVEALLCEIQETANETRCFKHWSNKGPNMENALEELSDCLHFVLSLGNDLNIDIEKVAKQPARLYKDLTEQFIAISYTTTCIAMYNDKEMYFFETIALFKGLVTLLRFTEEQLEQAYYDKNKVNHDRQVTGY